MIALILNEFAIVLSIYQLKGSVHKPVNVHKVIFAKTAFSVFLI